MKNVQNKVILELTKKLASFFGPLTSEKMKSDFKKDQSLVTEIDLFVSELLKQQLSSHDSYSQYSFYCEEDHAEYEFPCAILDPIDGTRELVNGRPECAVSLALMNSALLEDPRNYAWLYNPFSGFSLDSSVLFVSSLNKSSQKTLAFVSRTEFHKGLFDHYLGHSEFEITPRGSIAFKLGLLASGACDFVISLAPKNTWDIAAGTILCHQRGIHFYQNGIRVTALEKEYYEGVLIWAPESLKSKINNFFLSEFKNEKSTI